MSTSEAGVGRILGDPGRQRSKPVRAHALGRVASLFMALALACGTGLAAKPDADNHGSSHGKGTKKHAQEQPVGTGISPGTYFGSQHRSDVRLYYGKQRKAGFCPPGLAKKKNGCLPPGQAKKWAVGQPVPRAVVLYPVPQAVVIKIGAPPPGYRYVRVANDLLLIAIGTRMVVDAIEDLMGV